MAIGPRPVGSEPTVPTSGGERYTWFGGSKNEVAKRRQLVRETSVLRSIIAWPIDTSSAAPASAAKGDTRDVILPSTGGRPSLRLTAS